ncbi:translation initiation factor IF-2-like [Motacilla alba alba]|uniref:translation initiation factor IF-2-like n=1 Tax=Motacilla alba alba TaxID=1094192 RepID=UPI0018D4F6F7|nr:translation initiation factor IF-2-like [Motacilla alba alba]
MGIPGECGQEGERVCGFHRVGLTGVRCSQESHPNLLSFLFLLGTELKGGGVLGQVLPWEAPPARQPPEDPSPEGRHREQTWAATTGPACASGLPEHENSSFYSPVTESGSGCQSQLSHGGGQGNRLPRPSRAQPQVRRHRRGRTAICAGSPTSSCQRDKGGGGLPCRVGTVQLRTHCHAQGAAARQGHWPRASWQLLGSTCALAGQRRLQRAGKAAGAGYGAGRTLFIAGSVCTPAIAAAKAPAKGCPLPCGTTVRAKPSRAAAGADPPQPRLLWGTDRTVAPCRGAGRGLPRTKCPEAQPDGPRAPREEGAEAQGPAEPGRGSRSPPRAAAGARPPPRAHAAPGAGRRRHLPGGGGDCAGPGRAAAPQPRNGGGDPVKQAWRAVEQPGGSVAEWSKALDLGSSHFDGVGSNPTAAKLFSSPPRRLLFAPPQQKRGSRRRGRPGPGTLRAALPGPGTARRECCGCRSLSLTSIL